MASQAILLVLAISLAPASQAAVVRGSTFLATGDADQMRPEAVARILARVEDEWKEQATAFTECNATVAKTGCKSAPDSFRKSCATVVSAVVQGSAGKREVASEYMANVCQQKALANWQRIRCTDLASAIVSRAMTADSYANRERLDSTKLCASFWSKFVVEEEKREAKEAAERAAQKKKEAEEAAAKKKKEEEEAVAMRKKAIEEAKAEAARRVAEDARKAREAKEQEAKRKIAEAKAKATEAAARLAQKKAEAEAVQKAAQQKLEEAKKAEEEHLQRQAEHQRAQELLSNATKAVSTNATNATEIVPAQDEVKNATTETKQVAPAEKNASVAAKF